MISQYFGGAFVDGPAYIEQSEIIYYVQLKLGSDGVSIAFMFFIDFVVLWLRFVFSYFLSYAQLGFLYIRSMLGY